MTKNITLRLDEKLLKDTRKVASIANKSMAKWISDIIEREVNKNKEFSKARKNALIILEKPYPVKNNIPTRESLYD